MKKYLLSLFIVSVISFSCSKKEEPTKKQEEPIKKEEEEKEKKETISSYKNVELKLVSSDTKNYGVAFSSKTGKTYKVSEINKTNIANIDIVSFVSQPMTAFISPDDADDIKSIEGATKTKIQHTNIKMTVEQFDAIKDDSALKNLTIVDDKESQPGAYKGVFLFENADGKKGAIKTKEFNSQRVVIDIKVIK